MNDIIKNIEAAQLKEQAPEFRVGDTVKVYGKIKEGNRERIQIFLQRAAGLPVRKETGCADHGKADAKRRVESAESCGAVFCLVFHTNHLRPYSAPPVNIYTHPLQISGK